jgi:hypothetical protein
LPWYDAANGLSPLRAAAYAGAAALALGELAVLALALSPQVDATYRAYYIDRTTTCLDRRVSGDYALGETVSFRSDGAEAMKEIRVCGLDGPVDDGTHSVGTSSRLRVNARSAAPLVLRLTMNRAKAAAAATQHVRVVVDGAPAGEITLDSDADQAAEFALPAVLADGTAEITLEYADAVKPTPLASETRLRAIRLLSFQLAEQPAD